MNLAGVTPGTKLQLENGATVELLEPLQGSSRTVKIRYIDSPLWPVEPGTEESVSIDDVYGIYDETLGAVR